MSCLCVCHPHLTSIIVLTAVWAQACGLEHKTPFVIIVHFGSFVSASVFLFVLVCWWEQYHDTATSGTGYSDFRNRDNFWSVGMLVAWPQYLDSVIFVQDSETGDPQLVRCGTKPWRGNGKGLTRTKAVGPRFGQDPPPSFSAPTPPYTNQQWKRAFRLWQATSSLQKIWQGRWLLRQLKGESRSATEVFMDDALVQDWVTQDQRRSRRPSLRLRGGTSKRKPPSCPTWRGGNSIFNSWKMHRVRHCQQWSRVTQHHETQNLQNAATIRW